MIIVIYYHPAQALVQRYIIVDIIGYKKDSKTVSYYLIRYLVLIYQIKLYAAIDTWQIIFSV